MPFKASPIPAPYVGRVTVVVPAALRRPLTSTVNLGTEKLDPNPGETELVGPYEPAVMPVVERVVSTVQDFVEPALVPVTSPVSVTVALELNSPAARLD